MYDRIVVALDGSALSESTLPHAEELGRRLGVPLHLVRVADPVVLRFAATEAAIAYAELGGDLQREEEEAKEYLATTADRLTANGATVTTEVRRGLAARELAAAASASDLLAIASHGRGGARRWLLGSVAEDVTRHASCPVLLIHAAPESRS
jgi:nucleotide-binding universal stress UspA family protein